MTALAAAPRRAAAKDLPEIARLWLALARHHADVDPLFSLREQAGPEVRRLLEAQLGDPDAAIFVVGDAGRLLGFCAVRVDRAPPILEETLRAEIGDLAVEPSARRRGIGRALAETAQAWARGREAARVEVRVAAGNREGQAFWRALGFGDLMDVLQRRL